MEPVLEHLPTLLRGVGLTVFLAIVSFTLSVIFAVPLALARLSTIGPIRTLASGAGGSVGTGSAMGGR